VLVPVGSPVPDFELTDQAARGALSALKGKVVAVTFIYSRCPLPDYCPRMIENFRAVGSASPRGWIATRAADDQLRSASTTRRRCCALRRVATRRRPGWHFLTGDPANIERVCNAFGIQYWAEEGLITHSLQTAVIDRDGRLAATVEGKDFTPQQLGDLSGCARSEGAGIQWRDHRRGQFENHVDRPPALLHRLTSHSAYSCWRAATRAQLLHLRQIASARPTPSRALRASRAHRS
jgi:protein SCO1/2